MLSVYDLLAMHPYSSVQATVIGNSPASKGVPDSSPDEKVMPEGRGPLSDHERGFVLSLRRPWSGPSVTFAKNAWL
jgi:hypothetical protein